MDVERDNVRDGGRHDASFKHAAIAAGKNKFWTWWVQGAPNHAPHLIPSTLGNPIGTGAAADPRHPTSRVQLGALDRRDGQSWLQVIRRLSLGHPFR